MRHRRRRRWNGLLVALILGLGLWAPVTGHATRISRTQRTQAVVTPPAGQFLTRAQSFAQPDYLSDYTSLRGSAATVALTQTWLKTYRITALTGINLLNTEFTGSVATFSGGVHALRGRTTITNGQDDTWGSIINGGVSIGDNQLFFNQVKLLTDRRLTDQAMDYQTSRPTGNGEISGVASSQQTVANLTDPATIQQALRQISATYANLLPVHEVFDVAGVYGHVTKNLMGSAGTRDLGVAAGRHYYVVNIDSAKVANLQTSGFDTNDVVIYNDVSQQPTVQFKGGFTAVGGGQIIWNLPQATTVQNTTTITGSLLAPNAVLLTNQNVDDAMVLQYGAGYSNQAQAGIIADAERRYPVRQPIRDQVGDLLQTVVTGDGTVVTDPAALAKLVATGQITIKVASADGQQTYDTLAEIPTNQAVERGYRVTFTLDGSTATTWISIVDNEATPPDSSSDSDSSSTPSESSSGDSDSSSVPSESSSGGSDSSVTPPESSSSDPDSSSNPSGSSSDGSDSGVTPPESSSSNPGDSSTPSESSSGGSNSGVTPLASSSSTPDGSVTSSSESDDGASGSTGMDGSTGETGQSNQASQSSAGPLGVATAPTAGTTGMGNRGIHPATPAAASVLGIQERLPQTNERKSHWAVWLGSALAVALVGLVGWWRYRR